jgi:hypothetical protein
MRLLLFLALAGCAKDNACKSGTLLLDLTLDAESSQADTLEVTAVLPSGTLHAGGMLPKGTLSGTLELEFPDYPAGKMVQITIDAKLGGITVGQGSQPYMLDAGCSRRSFTIGSLHTDLAGVDFSGRDLLQSLPDLTGIDLAGADFSPAPDMSLVDPDSLPSCPLTVPARNCAIAGQPVMVGGTQCAQQFPPATTVPCTIPDDTGLVFYVKPAGSDSADGRSPATAWQTLCPVRTAPAHSTIHVAGGSYNIGTLAITSAITIKGGYDVSFSMTPDPDVNPTYIIGTLILDQEGAVWSGFRMIQHPPQGMHAPHQLMAGTFLRNYVEILYSTTDKNEHFFDGLLLKPCAGRALRLLCNDIYVKASRPTGDSVPFTTAKALSATLAAGPLELSQDRVCFDSSNAAGGNSAVFGTGVNLAESGSVVLTNDVVEMVPAGGQTPTVGFSAMGGMLDITVVNSDISGSVAVGGSNNIPAGMESWSLANNILFCAGCIGPKAFDIRGDLGPVQIAESRSNLIFGYTDNNVSPPPAISSGDTIGGATVASTFVSASDYHPSPSPGFAAGTGINLYNSASWPPVTVDLDNRPRPSAAPWDRGAYMQ